MEIPLDKETIMDLCMNHPDAWRVIGMALSGDGRINYRAAGMKEYAFRKAMKVVESMPEITSKKTNKFTSITISKSANNNTSSRAKKRAESRAKKDNWMPYKEATESWFMLCEKEIGERPVFGKTEGSKMKSILNKLKSKQKGNDDPKQWVLDRWNGMLGRYNDWPLFVRDQLDLKIIDSKFDYIIKHLKDGGSKPKGAGNLANASGRYNDPKAYENAAERL